MDKEMNDYAKDQLRLALGTKEGEIVPDEVVEIYWQVKTIRDRLGGGEVSPTEFLLIALFVAQGNRPKVKVSVPLPETKVEAEFNYIPPEEEGELVDAVPAKQSVDWEMVNKGTPIIAVLNGIDMGGKFIKAVLDGGNIRVKLDEEKRSWRDIPVENVTIKE